MKVLKDIKIAKGIVIKKGADVEMDGFGDIIITRGKELYIWNLNTYEIINKVRKQHNLKPL
jgi:hypothetical protein